MKLYFIFPIEGPNNGVKVISSQILKRLNHKDGVNVKKINTAQATDFSNFGKFQIFKVFYLFVILSKLIKIRKGDYVYMNLTPKGFAFYRDLVILWFCKFRKAKISVHIHANGLERKLSSFITKVFEGVQFILINENQFLQLAQLSQKVCLKNALPDFYKDNLQLKEKSNDSIKLIFFSNLSKEKGSLLLHNIIEEIDKKEIEIEVTICGGILDEISNDLISDIENKYNFVKYLGPVLDEQEKFNLFQDSSFLLFLSNENYEVYPLVYIEAIMSGLPVITTKQIVAEDIISDGRGFLLKSNNDFHDLFMFLEKYQKDKSLLPMLKKENRNNFEENYSFNDYVNNLMKIIVNES